MKILVTGSNGQLGSEIRAKSVQFPTLTFDFHDIDTLDLLDLKALENHFSANAPEAIVNCAAYTAVDKAENDRENATKGNVETVRNLAAMARKHNSRFIHISTDYVFDGNKNFPYVEEDQVNPIGHYGETKRLGETEALGYQNTMVVRTSWLYSSFGNNFVKTMLRLGKERDELGVIYDQVGTPTYAADLAGSILEILDKTSNGISTFQPGIYHYSNEGAISWYDFAKAIMELGVIQCNIKPIESWEYPTTVTRPYYSVLNKRKIKTTYNINIPYWKDSLKACMDKLDTGN
jgi:dTDP-4-dehydrorhamnose reductase